MSGSYYSASGDDWNDVDTTTDDDTSIERPCHRCYGSGQDRDGADCMHCDGFGSVIIR